MKVEAPPLFITFILVAGVSTVGITMAVKASREKPRAIDHFTKLTEPPAFDERFSEWALVPPRAKKQDRLTPIVAADQPAAMPVGVAVARTDVPQTVGTTESVRRHRNICQRNAVRKRKVWISSKQWSCRR